MANLEIKDKNFANSLATGDLFLVQTDPEGTRINKKFAWGLLSGYFSSAVAQGGVTGVGANGGVGSTGLINFSGAGNVVVSQSGRTFFISGNTTGIGVQSVNNLSGNVIITGTSGNTTVIVSNNVIQISGSGPRLYLGSGSPTGLVSADSGSLYSDWFNSQIYMKTGNGTSGWF